jgi:hypothetical protein
VLPTAIWFFHPRPSVFPAGGHGFSPKPVVRAGEGGARRRSGRRRLGRRCPCRRHPARNPFRLCRSCQPSRPRRTACPARDRQRGRRDDRARRTSTTRPTTKGPCRRCRWCAGRGHARRAHAHPHGERALARCSCTCTTRSWWCRTARRYRNGPAGGAGAARGQQLAAPGYERRERRQPQPRRAPLRCERQTSE